MTTNELTLKEKKQLLKKHRMKISLKIIVSIIHLSLLLGTVLIQLYFARLLVGYPVAIFLILISLYFILKGLYHQHRKAFNKINKLLY